MAATPEHAARVLGLDDQATLEEVREARRVLAKKYHPDCCYDLERSSRHMSRINAATDLLIAHLKSLDVRAKRASYRDFSGHRQANRKAQPEQETAEKPGPLTAQSDEPQPSDDHAARFDDALTAAMVIVPHQQKASTEDRELIRFAMASYRSVLDQISKVDAGPKVDAMALAYPVSA